MIPSFVNNQHAQETLVQAMKSAAAIGAVPGARVLAKQFTLDSHRLETVPSKPLKMKSRGHVFTGEAI